MKAIELPKELQPVVAVAEAAGEEPVVFTEKKRPVAMLVSLRKIDRESLALSTNPEFLRIMEEARKEIRAGQSTSLEEVERKLRGATPNRVAREVALPSPHTTEHAGPHSAVQVG